MDGSRSPVRQTHAAWALALTSVAFFMVALDSLVVVTALPSIQHDLRATLSTLEWTINGFTLAFAAGIIPAAGLGDRYGRRRVFMVGLTVFTLASAGCALAPTTAVLIAARTAQGLGAAMVMPLSLTILTSAFPAERRGAIVGVWGGIGGLAIASGPLVGGAVTQGLDWHWIFWINVPVGLIAVLLIRAHLPESKGPATTIDPLAVALVSGAAGALVWGLIRAGEEGWQNPIVVAAVAAGVLLAASFAAWELRAQEPMLPPALFRNRTFTAASATAFLMAGAIFAAAFLIAQYMQFGLGYSPLETGLRLLPWTATPMLIAPLAGMLADRTGARPVLVAGMLVQALGLGWFASLATTGAAYVQLVMPLFVAGVGISMALPVVPAVVVSAVAPPLIGKASGVNSTLQRLGAAFAIAVASAVFASHGQLGTPASFTVGFRPALAVVAGLSLLGAITASAVRSPQRRAAGLRSMSALEERSEAA